MLLAYRFRPIFRPTSPEQNSLDRYREAVTPIRTWLLVGVSVVLGAFAGSSGVGQWRKYLLWRNGVPFGQTDPYFNRDIGFYVFDLPWLHYLVDFAMAVLVIALIAAAVVHYLYGGIRLQSPHDRFSGAAQVQLSVLLGLFVLAKAADYWLDRFDLVNEGGALITGMTYTDDNAVLPAKNILMFIARHLRGAVLRQRLAAHLAAALGRPRPARGVGDPARPDLARRSCSSSRSSPPRPTRRQPYIKATSRPRARRTTSPTWTSGTPPSPRTSTSTQAALDGENVLDPAGRPALVKTTFEQHQQVRAYYSVAPVLDVDRYTIDGIDRTLVLGARELDQDGLPEDDQNWSNLHTVYTHGYGVIAAFANQRPEDNKAQIDPRPRTPTRSASSGRRASTAARTP